MCDRMSSSGRRRKCFKTTFPHAPVSLTACCPLCVDVDCHAAVRLADGSTQHFNLRQQAYKVTHEHSTRDSSGRSTRRGSEPPTSAPAAAGPQQAGQQQQESGGASAGKKQKQQASPSTNSAGGSVSGSKAGAVAVKERRPSVADAGASKPADVVSKPPRRAAADRAAAVAVAVSMGGNGGMHGREDGEKASRRPAPTPKAAVAPPAVAPVATRRAGDVAVDVGKRLAPLNMSHVSKKDREAARMLLAFNMPSGQEVGCDIWQPWGVEQGLQLNQVTNELLSCL